MGIAVDLLGNSYVADQNSATIRKITLDGMVTTLAGLAGVTGSSDGIGAGALFSYPAGLAVDAEGNVYVADRNNSNVRKISPAGVVSTLAGAAGTNGVIDGASASARFSFPTAVAIDDAGLVYVADTYANTIRLIRSAPPQAPVLRLSLVAGQLILSWPASATGFALETRGALSPEGSWVPVTSPVGVFGCSFVVTNSLASPSGFFRLHKR
jgi:sugar lactone lactonase YvrE